VRKILQSQKTFANHLDDFLAMQALAEGNPATTAAHARSGASTNTNKRPALGKKDTTPAIQKPSADEDVKMSDANLPPILASPGKPPPAAHPGDNDPLLASRVPELPSDEELLKLLAHPPLIYGEASGTWDDKYPRRVFCEVCGYWGRVRCMKCGTRVCALDCLETHKEECVTRYGI
jgi:zinc finger HIT domain-containing protein 1